MQTATGADVSDYQYHVLEVLFAAIYVVDAVFYVLAWLVIVLEDRDYDGKIVQIDAAALGELMYLCSALFGLAGAGCGFLIPVLNGTNLAKGRLLSGTKFQSLIFCIVSSILSALLAWAGLLWISNTLYLVDALIYWQVCSRFLKLNNDDVFFLNRAAWYNKYVTTEDDEKPNPCFDG